jgi:hypothetical protein
MLHGDRNLEIGILALMDQEMAAPVHPTTESIKLFTPTEAVAQLLPPVYHGVVPDEVTTSLVRNYTTL